MSFTDKISLDRIAKLHPKIRDEAKEIIESLWALEIKVRVTQGLRTIAEQDALYAQGRTTKGSTVTQARGGYSFHNYGLALDFCLLTEKGASWSESIDTNHDNEADWKQVVNAFIDSGWEWGDRGYVDKPHVQKVFGTTPKQLFIKSQGKILYPEI
jgi:peptidoglycan L-alanyl-D-glutamate endopeptidase CwlK